MRHTNADGHRRDSDAGRDAHTYTYAHAHAHTYPYAHAYANADANADSHANPEPLQDAGRSAARLGRPVPNAELLTDSDSLRKPGETLQRQHLPPFHTAVHGYADAKPLSDARGARFQHPPPTHAEVHTDTYPEPLPDAGRRAARLGRPAANAELLADTDALRIWRHVFRAVLLPELPVAPPPPAAGVLAVAHMPVVPRRVADR